MSPENIMVIMLPFTHKMFESSTVQKAYKKGAYIYHEGEDAQGAYWVLKGRVKLWKDNTGSSRSLIFYFIHPFEIFGLIDFFNRAKTRRCAATAIDNEVIVQYISFSELERCAFKDHAVNFAVIQFLIKNYESSWQRFHELKDGDISLKIFRVIQKLANEKGIITDAGIELRGIRHQELADYLGVSRQSVSVAMNNCRKEGKIEYDRNRILIKISNHG